MTGTLEILSAVVFVFTSLSVFACVLLGAGADRLMERGPFDSDFEEA
jgi:hypothetical protein